MQAAVRDRAKRTQHLHSLLELRAEACSAVLSVLGSQRAARAGHCPSIASLGSKWQSHSHSMMRGQSSPGAEQGQMPPTLARVKR